MIWGIEWILKPHNMREAVEEADRGKKEMKTDNSMSNPNSWQTKKL